MGRYSFLERQDHPVLPDSLKPFSSVLPAFSFYEIWAISDSHSLGFVCRPCNKTYCGLYTYFIILTSSSCSPNNSHLLLFVFRMCSF